MPQSTPSRPNVRFLQSLALPAVRTVLRGIQAVSRDTATDLLVDRFLTPRRHRVPRREAEIAAAARSVDVAGGGRLGRLRVLVWGEPGPTVLLVHGWEGRGAQLGAFVEPLLESGLRVVAFDQPAHGESEGGRTNLPEMAEAVARVGGLFGPLHGIVSHSLGAAATTIALADGLEARRVVTLASPVDFDGFLVRVARMLGLDPALAPEARRRIEARVGRDWRDLEGTRLAPDLRIPLLAFHDQADREISSEHSQRLVAAWPSSRLVTTRSLGHRRILRDAGVVAEVARYLAPRIGEGRIGDVAAGTRAA